MSSQLATEIFGKLETVLVALVMKKYNSCSFSYYLSLNNWISYGAQSAHKFSYQLESVGSHKCFYVYLNFKLSCGQSVSVSAFASAHAHRSASRPASLCECEYLFWKFCCKWHFKHSPYLPTGSHSSCEMELCDISCVCAEARDRSILNTLACSYCIFGFSEMFSKILCENQFFYAYANENHN